MTRGRLVVHGHFYQPSRIDPFGGRVPPDPAAAPFPDWNARITAECYRPNVERGNPDRMSFDLGPTLAAWLASGDPAAYAGFVGELAAANAMAQPYHHTILPLASAADRRTEIRWGLRDFAFRYGRPARGAWLPETAVDLATLRILAEERVRYTILAPWQAADAHLDTRQPYRVELGGGRSMNVAFYDAGLSSAVSFEPTASADADRFARERVGPRLDGAHLPEGIAPLAVIATDGELYGHHQPFRELFLQRLLTPTPGAHERRFDVVSLADAMEAPVDRPFPTVSIVEQTSWSCHHGVLRWSGECPDAGDGRWKGPLRSAFERLAASIDAVVEHEFAALPGHPDPWASRDAYVDVVIGAIDGPAFVGDKLGGGAEAATAGDSERLLGLLEAVRWRLAMFASDGWFWDDPMRVETRQCLRAAARAVRLVDGIAGTHIERRLVHDLALFSSPETGMDGAAIYRLALSEVSQPGPGA